MNINSIKIRTAKIKDAKHITYLCQQLGYCISQEKIVAYLKSLDLTKEWMVYVASQFDDSIVGWINIYLSHGLLAARQAEIGGLVVDKNFRGQGIGRLLIQKAHIWARQQECSLVQVRSRIARQQAHVFYQNIGYEPYKTQLVLRKYFVLNQ